jgi:hypothetical protein
MGIFMESMRHLMLDAAVADATWLSLHSADPGTTGTSEITGGTPAYARKQGTFSAASGGKRVLASDLTFDVPAATVAWVGLWTAETAGTFRGKHQVTSETFAAQGNYVVQATVTYFEAADPA